MDFRAVRNAEGLAKFLQECDYSKAMLHDDNLVIGYASDEEELHKTDYDFWFNKNDVNDFYIMVGTAQRYATIFDD